MMNKPYAPACDRNAEPILQAIKPLLTACSVVLEIGSGTGQHAVYFSEQMSHLNWHTSDMDENHDGIKAWISEARQTNLHGPWSLDVSQPDWPDLEVDAIFSANAVHIMSWNCVESLFSGTGRCLADDGLLMLYGPFNYHGEFTSQSNADFDVWLKQRDPRSGIRDYADLDQLARHQGMVLIEDIEMPSNNRILCWKKTNELITEMQDAR